MKKSLKIMAALLLISSVVGSTQFVNSVVNAEESAVYNDEVAGRRKMLEDEVEVAKEVLATPGLHDMYTADSIARLEAALADAQNVLDNNLENDYSVSYSDLRNARVYLVSTEVPESSSSESGSTESSSSESGSTESSSSESGSTESSSSESGSTESSSIESGSTESSSIESGSTESSSSESGSTESSSSESGSTESSSSEVAAPSIEVGSQTVTAYVGQTLTEDIILSWATFKNAEGLMVGFEVIGDPIQVTSLGNKLVETGTHTIRFFVSNPTQQRSVNNVVAEKEITLNVLPESDNPLNPALPGEETDKSSTATNLVSQVASPVSNSTTAKKEISSGKTTAKQLPSTGETSNSMMIASSGVLLIAGAYIFRKKQLNK